MVFIGSKMLVVGGRTDNDSTKPLSTAVYDTETVEWRFIASVGREGRQRGEDERGTDERRGGEASRNEEGDRERRETRQREETRGRKESKVQRGKQKFSLFSDLICAFFVFSVIPNFYNEREREDLRRKQALQQEQQMAVVSAVSAIQAPPAPAAPPAAPAAPASASSPPSSALPAPSSAALLAVRGLPGQNGRDEKPRTSLPQTQGASPPTQQGQMPAQQSSQGGSAPLRPSWTFAQRSQTRQLADVSERGGQREAEEKEDEERRRRKGEEGGKREEEEGGQREAEEKEERRERGEAEAKTGKERRGGTESRKGRETKSIKLASHVSVVHETGEDFSSLVRRISIDRLEEEGKKINKEASLQEPLPTASESKRDIKTAAFLHDFHLFIIYTLCEDVLDVVRMPPMYMYTYINIYVYINIYIYRYRYRYRSAYVDVWRCMQVCVHHVSLWPNEEKKEATNSLEPLADNMALRRRAPSETSTQTTTCFLETTSTEASTAWKPSVSSSPSKYRVAAALLPSEATWLAVCALVDV
ncbi:kelch repeat domain containing/Serine/threonine protein phosphatase protein, partial [Toxoplasma gondii GAB2-2007-GAL-DOM2]